MNSEDAALLVASALPDLKAQELRAIARVFDFLGIRVTQPGSSALAKQSLSIQTSTCTNNNARPRGNGDATRADTRREAATHEEVATGVEFDLHTRQWTLTADRPDNDPADDDTDNDNDDDSKDVPHLRPTPHLSTASAPVVLTLPAVRHDALQVKEEDATDWTLQIPESEHNRFLIDTRWEDTALGPMRTWPLVLQLMVLKMLHDPRPANLWRLLQGDRRGPPPAPSALRR